MVTYSLCPSLVPLESVPAFFLQWRSPEEARNEQNLTEKVDIFSMGHIFFRLICGHEPWNKLEPGGRPSKDEVNERVKRGDLPFIPEDIRSNDDPEVIAIRDAMLKCYTFDPKERPSARVIANELGAALEQGVAEGGAGQDAEGLGGLDQRVQGQGR